MLDKKSLENLNVLEFHSPNEAWLDFVVANRSAQPQVHRYDLVIGAVADDNTIPVITRYMTGAYSREQAIERLLPYKLVNQYAFLTEKAIALLKFEWSKIV